ncbi:MAG: translocation/assembly module TamB domain-containing protein, partial [Bacteroidales bacterium]|nr:translocation/assembly module TamB domain-containing protein [Bacteroidales bacterium]
SAEIILITNPTTGDEIRGRGNGSIRLVYDNIGDIELYGRYTLESGSYQFIIQDLLRRDFNILQGSTINFSGDPLEAEMNINAIYSVVNVSLSDLLDEAEIAALNLNRSSIPVNCSLLLTGELQHPNIELGLDFPSADEELKRRVMNVINTDEMLNRQIVYLMLLNRFAAAENTQAQAGNNVNAVVGATLSSLSNQLNNMIYQALGSSFLTFDFNYRYDDLVSQGLGEWQLAMSSQLLDNRLIINGNIGSREDLVSNNTQFIGDFDLEYKFSQSGRWRLKMFNRSNDNRYFKSAMTTQGVGLGYRESFNNLLELRQLFAERIADQIIKSLKESDLKK